MKAMILAAGRGLRMRPLTDHTHKGLLKVHGEMLIERQIKRLQAIGITDFVINLSYMAERVQQVLGDGADYGVSIQYSIESYPLETGGGVIAALPILGDDPFILHNCDLWSDYPLENLKGALQDSLGHLVLVKKPLDVQSGDFGLSNGYVTFEEDPPLTYTGMGIYRPELFKNEKLGVLSLLSVLEKGIENRRITGEYYSGSCIDINTPERLKTLNQP